MADKRDYYEVLGVQKNATEAEIKSAFRKQAKSCHPDLHPGDKEAEANTVAVRNRKGKQDVMSLADFIAQLSEEVRTKAKPE